METFQRQTLLPIWYGCQIFNIVYKPPYHTLISDPRTGGAVGWNSCCRFCRRRHLRRILGLLPQWSQGYCSCFHQLKDPATSHRSLTDPCWQSLGKTAEVAPVAGVHQRILEASVICRPQLSHSPISWRGGRRCRPRSWQCQETIVFHDHSWVMRGETSCWFVCKRQPDCNRLLSVCLSLLLGHLGPVPWGWGDRLYRQRHVYWSHGPVPVPWA